VLVPYSEEEFTSKYGASGEDLKEVPDFAVKNGLKVEETAHRRFRNGRSDE
jgi:hypothetical protein